MWGLVIGQSVSGNKVRFLDADGTVISTQYVPVGGSAVLPPTPHLDTALTFDGWVGASSNIQAPIDIIASYHPTDGYTHYNINLNSITGLTTTVYFYKNDGSTLTVDWGDGTVVTSTATGNATLSHTFAAAGSYSVRAAITSGSGYSQMGQGTQVFGPTQLDILQSVWMRASQSDVAASAFQGYRGLDYAIGSGVTSIGASAFQDCYAATSFSFPLATSIGTTAFQACLAAPSFSFPLATSIGASAFQYCYAATSFSFPLATSIGTTAFQDCYAATSFSFPLATSIGTYAFQSCYAATSFSFPLATSIGIAAFQGCRKILTVTFGSPSISLVDSYAFDGDFALNSITFASTVPPTLTSTNAFTLNSFTMIYVPTASVSAYKAATNWVSFSTRIVGY
jgi:hypothetical protein